MAELEATLTPAELDEWTAFARLAPFGPEADDLRAGLAAAVSANPHRGRGRRALRGADFMLGGLARDAAREDAADRLKRFFGGFRKAAPGSGPGPGAPPPAADGGAAADPAAGEG